MSACEMRRLHFADWLPWSVHNIERNVRHVPFSPYFPVSNEHFCCMLVNLHAGIIAAFRWLFRAGPVRGMRGATASWTLLRRTVRYGTSEAYNSIPLLIRNNVLHDLSGHGVLYRSVAAHTGCKLEGELTLTLCETKVDSKSAHASAFLHFNDLL